MRTAPKLSLSCECPCTLVTAKNIFAFFLGGDTALKLNGNQHFTKLNFCPSANHNFKFSSFLGICEGNDVHFSRQNDELNLETRWLTGTKLIRNAKVVRLNWGISIKGRTYMCIER